MVQSFSNFTRPSEIEEDEPITHVLSPLEIKRELLITMNTSEQKTSSKKEKLWNG